MSINNMKYISASVLVLFVLGLIVPNAFAENVPKAFFGGADLSNANLSGVTGEMLIDENTILKCVGHPICNS